MRPRVPRSDCRGKRAAGGFDSHSLPDFVAQEVERSPEKRQVQVRVLAWSRGVGRTAIRETLAGVDQEHPPSHRPAEVQAKCRRSPAVVTCPPAFGGGKAPALPTLRPEDFVSKNGDAVMTDSDSDPRDAEAAARADQIVEAAGEK